MELASEACDLTTEPVQVEHQEPGMMPRHVLELELDAAWAIQREHEQIAMRRSAECKVARKKLKRLYPKILAFDRTSYHIQRWIEGEISAEAALDNIREEIRYANEKMNELEAEQKANAS